MWNYIMSFCVCVFISSSTLRLSMSKSISNKSTLEIILLALHIFSSIVTQLFFWLVHTHTHTHTYISQVLNNFIFRYFVMHHLIMLMNITIKKTQAINHKHREKTSTALIINSKIKTHTHTQTHRTLPSQLTSVKNYEL